jgi:hypothetical protein
MLVNNKKRRFLIFGCFLFLLAVFLFVILPHVSFAQNLDLGTSYGEKIGLTNKDPRLIAAQIIRVILGFLGIIAVSLIIYAGFLWMTSQGDEQKIEKAKNIIKNAVIGLIIILASFAIVSFIINKLMGNDMPGPGGDNGPGQTHGGLGALGAGIIKSVYPEPYATEVPRNTSIIVTFRERMDARTICENTQIGSGGFEICSPNSLIKKENVRIFKVDDGDSCINSGGNITNCDTKNVVNVRGITNDSETFVFIPVNYLGDPVNYYWYAVNLTNDIHKANGQAAFGSVSTGFEWRFQVSNKLDMAPPQVLSVADNGMFPPPDNERDQLGATDPGAPAHGSVTVIGQPKAYKAASTSPIVPNGTSPTVKITGIYSCKDDGNVNVSIGTYSGQQNRTLITGPSGFLPGDATTDNELTLGCGLRIVPLDPKDVMNDGDSWTFTVNAEVKADYLTINNTSYMFVAGKKNISDIQLGATTADTAQNIKNIIESHPLVTTAVSGDTVSLTTESIGSAGNNIELSTTNPQALTIIPFAGGRDKSDTIVKKGRRDKARNSVIQVDFNESVMPLELSGSSTAVRDTIRVVNAATSSAAGAGCSQNSDCLSYNCSGTCVGNELAGKFMISNQYKTVEFISNIQCGVNTCGEPVYCLPENSNLKVELSAAPLETCAQNSDCAARAPYVNCNVHCQDPNGNNFPSADKNNITGVMDTALNSLDGNRDKKSVGPAGYYYENYPSAADGDSFRWSFYISELLDLNSPIIKLTDAASNQVGVNMVESVKIDFNKMMMSSTLTSGSVDVGYNGNTYNHKYINIWSLTSQPIGYWVVKEDVDDQPKDGEIDWTSARLAHTQFSEQTRYRSQAGSAIKDIYQNCYRPAIGPACANIQPNDVSCCNGAWNTQGVCP